MKYKKFEKQSYNIYTIKTDKFKNCHMEIIFRSNINSEQDLLNNTFLVDLMSDCSMNYKNRKGISIKLEDLYRASFYGATQKVGSTLFTSFVFDFLNPKYALEDDYLSNVLRFPFDVIMNPYVENDEFNITAFNIVKNRLRTDIENIKENPTKLTINHALKAMDEDSITSFRMLGNLDMLEDITPNSLYNIYKKFIDNSVCDIFIIGDLDMDKVAKLIGSNFKLRAINNNNFKYTVENKTRKKAIVLQEQANYVQANLVEIFNLNNLTERESNYVFRIFNYIFGDGALNSKLMKYLREENNICYDVSSMYLKRDNILMVQLSLDQDSIDIAVKGINKALNEMIKGDFSDEDIDEAIRAMNSSLDVSLDSQNSIFNNYIFNIYDNTPLLEDIKKNIKTVTKQEVVKVAKKIKLNTVYSVVKGGN